MEILTDKVVAEAVYRAYLRERQHHILAAQMTVRWILRQLFEYRRTYSLTHLRCCGFCEGDDEQIFR